MTYGLVLDSFLISGKKIYVIDFSESDFRPSMGGKLLYNDVFFDIQPYGTGSHSYYDEKGELYPREVWSCILKNIDDPQEDVNIPKGSKLTVWKAEKNA